MKVEASNAPLAFAQKASGRHEFFDGNALAEFHFPPEEMPPAGLMACNAGHNADVDAPVA